jgi:hypothetical protein
MGSYPALLSLADEAAYRAHFAAKYCRAPLTTFDGIVVRFRKDDFDHCCFESDRRTRQKAYFSTVRATRLDWIVAALRDPTAELFAGWDQKKHRYDHGRRVCVVVGNYVVVISLTGPRTAHFVTAYLADSGRTISMIRTSPKWTGIQT